MRKKKVIFVCTGNTCRSNMAEALAKDFLRRGGTGEDRVEVKSAGTMALPGLPAAENAVKVLKERGIDLADHSAGLLTANDVQSADLILTMTAAHREQVLAMAPDAGEKVFTLAAYSGCGADISDPFGGSEEMYRKCAAEIEVMAKKALEKFLSAGGGDNPPD